MANSFDLRPPAALAALLLPSFVTIGAGAAWAGEAAAPGLSGEIGIELQSDSTFKADDPNAELSDTYATIEAALALQLTDVFSLHTGLVFEPVLDPIDDRAFEDEGLYVEELYAMADLGVFSVKGGKFNPAFAIGWDAAPGLYGADFAEDYELAEQIGAGVAVPFRIGGGEHTLSAAVFFADTSALSDSIFQVRGRTRKSDGGAGNTESLENFAVALDGEVAGTTYSLGVRRLAAGVGDQENETGFSVGLTREFALGGGTLGLLGETVWLVNAGGAQEDAFYAVTGISYGLGDWTASAAYTLRDVETLDADHLLAATLEYDVGHGFGLAAGYGYAVEQAEEAHTIGLLATYGYEF